MLRELIDALADGVALTDDAGILALANRRLGEMFGYEHAELIGQPAESLVPADLRTAHRSHWAPYAQALKAGPMGARAGLVGLRKDGTTFPVEISLSPVPTATGRFTLAVVRDITERTAPVILEALIPGGHRAMPARRKYPEKLRESAVRMVFEIRDRDGKGCGELAQVARQYRRA